jgi:hypothetical protein
MDTRNLTRRQHARELNTTAAGYPGEIRLEVEDNQGAPSMVSVEERTVNQCLTNLMEQILDRNNLNGEYLKVKGKKRRSRRK